MSMTFLEDQALDQVVGGLTLFVGQNGPNSKETSLVFDAAHNVVTEISYMKAVTAPPAAIPGATNAFSKVGANTEIANITVGAPIG